MYALTFVCMKLFVSAFLISLICLFYTANGQQLKDTIYTYKKASPGGQGKFYKGREIAQVMSFEGAGWLERNSRPKEENTNLAISKLPISENSVVADIGAGTGYYTFRISPKVPQG